MCTIYYRAMRDSHKCKSNRVAIPIRIIDLLDDLGCSSLSRLINPFLPYCIHENSRTVQNSVWNLDDMSYFLRCFGSWIKSYHPQDTSGKRTLKSVKPTQ